MQNNGKRFVCSVKLYVISHLTGLEAN